MMPSNRELVQRVGKRDTLLPVIIAAGMIISDCYQYFGSWTTLLKYFALALSSVSSFYYLCKEQTQRRRYLLIISGLALLTIVTVYSAGHSSPIQALGLFFLVSLIALSGDKILRSYESYYYCGIVCTLLIGFLLVVSIPESVEQLSVYLPTGRLRIKGCFSNANSLGHISAVAFTLSLIARLRTKCLSRRRVRACDISLFLDTVFIILSGSRTAFACAGAFAVAALFIHYEARLSSKTKLLWKMTLGFFIISACVLSYQDVITAYLESGRALGWTNLGSLESLFGYGYASSANVSNITEIAGGNVEMLWMSAYYRVGILGIVAYCFIFLGAIAGKKRDKLVYPFIFFLLIQSLGESYMTSVMSFPSLFGWIIATSLASIYDHVMPASSGITAEEHYSMELR